MRSFVIFCNEKTSLWWAQLNFESTHVSLIEWDSRTSHNRLTCMFSRASDPIWDMCLCDDCRSDDLLINRANNEIESLFWHSIRFRYMSIIFFFLWLFSSMFWIHSRRQSRRGFVAFPIFHRLIGGEPVTTTTTQWRTVNVLEIFQLEFNRFARRNPKITLKQFHNGAKKMPTKLKIVFPTFLYGQSKKAPSKPAGFVEWMINWTTSNSCETVRRWLTGAEKKRIRGKNVKSRWTHWSALLDEKMSRERENFPIIIILSEAKIWREVGQMRLSIFRCWHWQYKSDTESAAFKHVQPIRFAINIARCMHMCVGGESER